MPSKLLAQKGSIMWIAIGIANCSKDIFTNIDKCFSWNSNRNYFKMTETIMTGPGMNIPYFFGTGNIVDAVAYI